MCTVNILMRNWTIRENDLIKKEGFESGAPGLSTLLGEASGWRGSQDRSSRLPVTGGTRKMIRSPSRGPRTLSEGSSQGVCDPGTLERRILPEVSWRESC